MTKELVVSKKRNINVTLSSVESSMLSKIKKHYGFESDGDLVRALLSRANMNLK